MRPNNETWNVPAEEYRALLKPTHPSPVAIRIELAMRGYRIPHDVWAEAYKAAKEADHV